MDSALKEFSIIGGVKVIAKIIISHRIVKVSEMLTSIRILKE